MTALLIALGLGLTVGPHAWGLATYQLPRLVRAALRRVRRGQR